MLKNWKWFWLRRWSRCVEWYWRQPQRKRRVVGRAALLTSMLVVVFSVYGIYRGGVAVGEWISSGLSDKHVSSGEKEYFPVREPRRSYHFTRHDKKRFIYGRDFNDLNDTQLVAARRIGIRPIEGREQAEAMKKELVCIRDSRYYKVDPLTHSIPYLVPEAADFLVELGKLFQEYSGTSSRFIITSVLRTRSDVKRLRRSGNVNASENSCHFYATTIDIAYNRFDRHGKTWDGKLKENLAQALYDLRAAGYCYVKYEYKQACFHVTVRP